MQDFVLKLVPLSALDPESQKKGKAASSSKKSTKQSAKTVSQPDSNKNASNTTPGSASPTISTKTKKSALLENEKIKKEPVIDLISDNDDDTISLIATSYKKRLDNKERANSDAKAKIKTLEEQLLEKDQRIDQLEQEEKKNLKFIEYNLAGYTRDKKRYVRQVNVGWNRVVVLIDIRNGIESTH